MSSLGLPGADKTAAVRALEARALPGIRCYYFDTIGVPSAEGMDRNFGGPEKWQALATQQWLDRLAGVADGTEVCVLDGQTRPSFVRTAAERAGIAVVQVVLLECAPEVRHARLAQSRGQPELCNPQMDSWAVYLRGQADALSLPVIDTTGLEIPAVVDVLVTYVETVRGERSLITSGLNKP